MGCISSVVHLMSIKVKQWLFQFVQNVIKFDYIEDGLSLKIKKIHIHLYFTVLVKLCPYERYRQLDSALYPNNHILKSSKIIFNGLVLKDF